jgi:hypothetical protein
MSQPSRTKQKRRSLLLAILAAALLLWLLTGIRIIEDLPMWLPRSRFWMWSFVIVTTAVATLYLSFTLVIAPMRAAANDMACKVNLRAIGLALQSYDAHYGCYPPAYTTDASGRPMHSWRALILPYAGEHSLFKSYRLDEPWDGPHNSRLAGRMPSIYGCPAHLCPGYSSYAVVVGAGTAFPGRGCVSLAQISDPRATLVVELKDGGIPWLEPRDLSVPAFKTTAWTPYKESCDKDLIDLRRQGLAGDDQHPFGANFLFSPAEAESWRLYDSHGEILRAMLTINGGEIWYHDDRF